MRSVLKKKLKLKKGNGGERKMAFFLSLCNVDHGDAFHQDLNKILLTSHQLEPSWIFQVGAIAGTTLSASI